MVTIKLFIVLYSSKNNFIQIKQNFYIVFILNILNILYAILN